MKRTPQAELLETVTEYESDTFSASAAEMTKREARQVTALLVEKSVAAFIDHGLDGIEVDTALATIRRRNARKKFRSSL